MDLINDWAGGDLSEDCGWRFVPAICFECEIPNSLDQFCSVCSKFIIHGSNTNEQVRRMLREIPIPTNARRTREKARKQFIKVAEFFLFFASFDTITTPSQLKSKVSKMVQKAGSAKIIEMYRCWTPNQLPLLKGNILRVLFMTAPSTGKTAMMEDKALKCFELGGNVMFVIPYGYQDKIKTLLALKMKQKYEKLNENHGGENKFHVCFIKTKWSSAKRNLSVDYDNFRYGIY